MIKVVVDFRLGVLRFVIGLEGCSVMRFEVAPWYEGENDVRR